MKDKTSGRPDKNPEDLMRERALRLLNMRMYSHTELVNKLCSSDGSTLSRSRRQDEDETVLMAERVVSRLEALGLLNDGFYAGALVRHYAAKGYGAGRIRSEMTRRGIDRNLQEQALCENPPAEEAIDRFLRTRMKNPGDRDERRKLSAALARRGYGWEEIRAAFDRLHAGTEEE